MITLLINCHCASVTGGSAEANSRCYGKAGSETRGKQFATDDACAGIAQVKACEGPGKDMCCDPSFTRPLCTCNRPGVRCKDGPWRKKSDYNEEANTRRSFETTQKEVCFCLDY